jgi:hypothetical protein
MKSFYQCDIGYLEWAVEKVILDGTVIDKSVIHGDLDDVFQ